MKMFNLRGKQTIEQFIRSVFLFVQLRCSFIHKLLQMIGVFLHHGDHVFNDVWPPIKQQNREGGRVNSTLWHESFLFFYHKFVMWELWLWTSKLKKKGYQSLCRTFNTRLAEKNDNCIAEKFKICFSSNLLFAMFSRALRPRLAPWVG